MSHVARSWLQTTLSAVRMATETEAPAGAVLRAEEDEESNAAVSPQADTDGHAVATGAGAGSGAGAGADMCGSDPAPLAKREAPATAESSDDEPELSEGAKKMMVALDRVLAAQVGAQVCACV